MLNDYKRKFVLSNMVLVGVVLFFSLSSIFAYSLHMRVSDLRSTMAQFTKPFENRRDISPSPEKKDARPPEENPGSHAEQNKSYRRTITVFFCHVQTGEISLLSETSLYHEKYLQTIASKIVASSDSFGKLPEENLYFYQMPTRQIIKIAVADTSAVWEPAMELLAVLLAIFLCTMLFFYFISRHMANIAIRPLDLSLKLEKQFVTDISHDLKTPVTVILANMAILLRNRNHSVADMSQWVEGTETAAKNLQTLIEEMLTLSTVESAEHRAETETLSFSHIAETVSLFMEPVAYEKNITYHTDISDHIYIRANEEYLQRIVQSLIENAIKYEPAGGSVTISLSMRQNRAIFSTHNKLSVIAQNDLPLIFEKFYRTDPSRQNNEGHGLGLAITKRMVSLMNGKIEASSSKEQGTTFYVSFKTVTPSSS